MKHYYDLHIHSCLSPCGDEDNTPYNIVNMAKLNGLSIIAVADHNSVDNVRAAMVAGEKAEIIVVPALELTTEEDVHILCLFEELALAKEFVKFAKEKMLKIKNKPEIFGRQIIYDENDKIVGEEPYLLLPSTSLPSYRVKEILKEFGGKAIPAHIDRSANGMLSILGNLDETFLHSTLEFSLSASDSIKERFKNNKKLINSDAHTLESISDAQNYLDLAELSIKNIIKCIE